MIHLPRQCFLSFLTFTHSWKTCVSATNSYLGDILSRYYVMQRFAGGSKQSALQMIQDVEAAFAAAVPGLTWMDDVTRVRALGKLRAIFNKIGFPDHWTTYEDLIPNIRPGQVFASVAAARKFNFDRDFATVQATFSHP